MKTYYVYNHKYLVSTIQATSIADAASKISANVNYDAITTVYQPEPRTVGEVVDDSIDAAKRAVPTVRTKLSNIFGNLSRMTAPVPPQIAK